MRGVFKVDDDSSSDDHERRVLLELLRQLGKRDAYLGLRVHREYLAVVRVGKHIEDIRQHKFVRADFDDLYVLAERSCRVVEYLRDPVGGVWLDHVVEGVAGKRLRHEFPARGYENQQGREVGFTQRPRCFDTVFALHDDVHKYDVKARALNRPRKALAALVGADLRGEVVFGSP